MSLGWTEHVYLSYNQVVSNGKTSKLENDSQFTITNVLDQPNVTLISSLEGTC